MGVLNMRWYLVAVAIFMLAPASWAASMIAGTTATIATGGAAVVAVTGPVNGCYIVNPATAGDQGIATAENAFVDPVTTSTTTGNGTNTTIEPGRSWSCPVAVPAGKSISVNAATSGHKVSVVVW